MVGHERGPLERATVLEVGSNPGGLERMVPDLRRARGCFFMAALA